MSEESHPSPTAESQDDVSTKIVHVRFSFVGENTQRKPSTRRTDLSPLMVSGVLIRTVLGSVILSLWGDRTMMGNVRCS